MYPVSVGMPWSMTETPTWAVTAIPRTRQTAHPAAGASGECRAKPGERGRNVRRVDLMSHVGLVIGDVEPAPLEQVARAAGELDIDDRVVATVCDENREARAACQIRRPPFNRGDEPGEREDAGRNGPFGVQAERVAHHRPHREAAQHRPRVGDSRPLPELVVKRGQAPTRVV